MCELDKVVATTRQGRETSRKIRFMKGIPQGDALCPRLFTLCLNLVAWRLRATEGKVPVTAARARNLLRNSQEMQFLCGKECYSVSDWKMRA